MRAGWQDDGETREALRRGRELSRLEEEQRRLRADPLMVVGEKAERDARRAAGLCV